MASDITYLSSLTILVHGDAHVLENLPEILTLMAEHNGAVVWVVLLDEDVTIEAAHVLCDIRQKGYSSIQPFSVGKIEERMLQFSQSCGITLGSDELYMSAKQLQHCMRASKNAKGLVVDDADLISFPQNRFQMDLYYDGECFIYTDGVSKFIIHPNYKMKVSREVVKLVNFITATRRTDKKEFNGKRYIKI